MKINRTSQKSKELLAKFVTRRPKSLEGPKDRSGIASIEGSGDVLTAASGEPNQTPL